LTACGRIEFVAYAVVGLASKFREFGPDFEGHLG
jgi:hypothetical protein